MAATNRYMNFSGVTFNATAVAGVKSISYNEGLSYKSEGAGYDVFPTVGLVDYAEPSVTLETIDAFALYLTLGGATATLAFTIRDAYNGATASGGAKTYTCSNAKLTNRTQGNTYRTYSTVNLTFTMVSTDGSTHPVSIANV